MAAGCIMPASPACGVCVLARTARLTAPAPPEPMIAAELVRGPETEHLLALAVCGTMHVDPLDAGAPRRPGCARRRLRAGTHRQPDRSGGATGSVQRTHRDADTAEALAGRGSDLPPCLADGPGSWS